jgi:hypothetical protein
MPVSNLLNTYVRGVKCQTVDSLGASLKDKDES